MNFSVASQDILSNSTIAFVEANVVTSAVTATIPDLIESNNKISVAASAETTHNGYSQDANPQSTLWNSEGNQRFKQLALKESVDELSAEEVIELNALTRLRRLSTYPRPAHEILWERKVRKSTDNLIRALADHVELLETTH
jgi:hypothetical protein